jgi:hypothetical protein
MAMNLIDVAEELEFIPEDQLAAMIDDPNSRYPSFMVLSEVQRRTKMRKMYENEMSKMNQPQTTVAEEAVMGLMQGQGAMPMQAGMSSPVNSQGSGLQGMAPPVQMQAGGLTDLNLLTAFMRQNLVGGSTANQTYSPNRMNNMFDKLLMQAQANDPKAIANIQTLLNLPEFQTFKQQQQAQPPSVLAQSFPDMTTPIEIPFNPEAIVSTGESFDPPTRPPFTREYSISSPSASEPLMALTTEEERDKFRGYPRTDLPLAGRDVFAIGKTQRAAIEKERAERAGLSQMQPDQVTPETTGELTQAGIDAGLQLAQRLKQSDLTNSQFRMLNKSDDGADDTAQAGLASANNPDLTDIQKRYQEEIDKIFTPADEFVSQLGDPVTLRTREQITEDVSSRLNLPEVTALKPTEEERQKDMNVALLTGLGAIIGGARRPGDIATGIGKLGRDITQMRKEFRKEDRLADRLTRQETIQNINLISGIVNAEQAAERATKQLQIQERKDFDAGQLAKTQLEISRAKLVEGGLRLELAERANAQGLAKFDLDQIKALQAQVQNLQASLVADPLINVNPTKAARIQGQIDALNEEINRRFNVPDLEKELAEAKAKIEEATKQNV